MDGAFIETAGQWRPGTLIHLVLQRRPDGRIDKGPAGIFGLWSKVVRLEPDGMAVQFLHGRAAERNGFREFLTGLHANNGRDEGNEGRE